jgi:V8-like Glu-specific endopeptidase
MARRAAQFELTIEDLDRELIARGAQIPHEELFKFEDTEGTPARKDLMDRVKELYDKAPSPNPALASIDTWELFRLLLCKTQQIEENRKRGIWYEDHRMDWFGITDEQVNKNVNSVAAIILKNNLIGEGNGFFTLKVKNYGKAHNLCEVEPFYNQPVTAGWVCTGFLVKKDVIATAGHCVEKKNVTDFRIVFGYKMLDPHTAVTQVPDENIYKGVKIIRQVLNREVNRSDWALVQLDREVAGQEVVVLSEDVIACDQPVYVIGYPMGLPVKYAPGAKVRGFKDAFFAADLDTYMGNSGSPVFNADTHKVIGMVVHGDTQDLRWTGKGWASVIYPSREIKSRKPQCTSVPQFKNFVDKL